MPARYAIQYAREAANDVRGLRPYDRARILSMVEEHLRHDPMRISKSRIKQMLQPFWSQFRLRVDDFRVYYDVDEEQMIVSVLRVIEKGSSGAPTENAE
ncbi:MAG: type II toxin-antitoxin system RelE/ParE family toxin [Tepidisphaeraceae bacterium]|jgi:mRNA-degrading endonuclease RelE of RelBE toxin-antitoxin system